MEATLPNSTQTDQTEPPKPPTLELPKEITKSAQALKALEPSQFNSNLERFHHYCKDFPSMEPLIDFDFLFMISSCLARKKWMNGIFANMYVLTVADPGLGKSLPATVVGKALNSLESTYYDATKGECYTKKLVKIAPDAITFEKLVLRTAQSTTLTPWIGGPKKHYAHTSVTFCLSGEMGMLFTDNTKRVVSFLTQGWDCDKIETDTIKHGEVNIRDVCINFLGCTVPEMMGDLMRTKILDHGFTARALFLYADRKRWTRPEIIITPAQELEMEHIKLHLRNLCNLNPGALTYTKEASDWLRDWVLKNDGKRPNTNPKLKHYYARKPVHLQKVAINIHFSDNLTDTIGVESLIKAEKMLASIEPTMHKAMAAKGEFNNSLVSEELKSYLAEKGEVSKGALLLKFYSSVERRADLDEILQLLKDTNVIEEIPGDGKITVRLVKKG